VVAQSVRRLSRGSIPDSGNNVIFPLSHRLQTGSKTHPYSLRYTWDSYPGREADRSPPYGAEIKKRWRCDSNPPIRPHDMVLS
jgi:hypothetical protein